MESSKRKRLIWSAIIIVILALTLIPESRKVLFEKHFFRDIDSKATEYVNESVLRASAVYVLARSFNGVISVLQESELQLEPAGIGVSVALGQALDPVNDLVERFSWVMLVSLTSLGIQKFLIEIMPFVSVQIVFVLALLSLLLGLWLPSKIHYDFSRLGKVLLFSAILLRFAVPTMSYMNQMVYVAVLEDEQQNSVGKLQNTVTNLGAEKVNGSLGEPGNNQDDIGTYVPEDVDMYVAEPETWWEKQIKWWERKAKEVLQAIIETKQKLDTELVKPAKKIAEIETMITSINLAAKELVDKIVELIVVFVLSTIMLPLLFLWGFLKVGRFVVGVGINDVRPKSIK